MPQSTPSTLILTSDQVVQVQLGREVFAGRVEELYSTKIRPHVIAHLADQMASLFFAFPTIIPTPAMSVFSSHCSLLLSSGDYMVWHFELGPESLRLVFRPPQHVVGTLRRSFNILRFPHPGAPDRFDREATTRWLENRVFPLTTHFLPPNPSTLDTTGGRHAPFSP
jgi:hypothetical protein